MEENNAQEKITLKQALNKGIEIGKDLNESKAEMRKLIAKKIKECRLELNLTQEQISDRIHMNYLTYRGYENCKSDIPIVYLVRLADVFDVSLDYLTGRTDTKNGSAIHVTSEDTEKRLMQLENAIAELTKKIQDKEMKA